jgi:hypothetical protein
MKVLSLTHAHLSPEGLSPVSCERADSITGTWGQMAGWRVDVIHTTGTKWRGIWPEGTGLPIKIIKAEAPQHLMFAGMPPFAAEVKRLAKQKKMGALVGLVKKRISYRLNIKLANKGLATPHALQIATTWGKALAQLPEVRQKQYDFIFVCAGYGDEYLLQTAYVLSRELNAPIIADLRDLWSDHHEQERFTDKQRRNIRKYEQKIFAKAMLVSVPQVAMVHALERWMAVPVYLASHSAHIDPAWPDGKVVGDAYRILYAGKLYPASPGSEMLMEMLRQFSKAESAKPVQAVFYVDEPARLREMVQEYGIAHMVSINDWITPGQLWGEIRSAHLLITFDTGINMPLVMTKVFQYALSGRRVLALYKDRNVAYEHFFGEHPCGDIYYDVGEAVNKVAALIEEQEQYKQMPALRKVPTREEIALAYGRYVEDMLHKQAQ